MSPIRISVVSYLNSKPFIYGLEHSKLLKNVQLSLDTPVVCANKLLNNEADIGLVPVAILPQMPKAQVISDYCIGAVGAVSSVKLYSQVSIDKVENILLDYQSYTSIALARMLAKEYWGINPKWIDADVGYEAEIVGTTAGVVIGDRTFELNTKFKFQYDLSEEWFKLTKLPFVFACWVSNKRLDVAFLKDFNTSLSMGLTELDTVVNEILLVEKYQVDVFHYLKHFISYVLDDEKRKGLSLFLDHLTIEKKSTLLKPSF